MKLNTKFLLLTCLLLLSLILIATKWSDYGELSTGTIADGDDILVRDVSDTTMAATGTQKRYLWSSIKDSMSFLAGRSITFDDTNDELDIDSEIYTDTHCLYLEYPTASDDLKSFWMVNGFSVTIKKIQCESDGTVNMDLQVDDGSPADVNGTDLVCDSTPAEDESMGGDATMADGNRLDLAITSVSGDPTWVSICWTYEKDD